MSDFAVVMVLQALSRVAIALRCSPASWFVCCLLCAGRLEQDPKCAKLDDDGRKKLRKAPPQNWICHPSAICVFEDRVFIADTDLRRITVWHALTFTHLYNIGEQSAPLQTAPYRLFPGVVTMALYRSHASVEPVLVLALDNSRAREVLIYSLDGAYLGAQPMDLHEYPRLACPATPGAPLWSFNRLPRK